jgi:hypothetical protein
MVARKALLGGVTAAPDRLQSRTFTVLVELTNMTPRTPEGRFDGQAGATASPGFAPVTVKDWSGAQALLEMLEKVSVAEFVRYVGITPLSTARVLCPGVSVMMIPCPPASTFELKNERWSRPPEAFQAPLVAVQV